MERRIDKINYYLDIAETVSERSTCLRKKYGSIIVKHDQIIATGYSGAPRGRINCCDLGYCTKKKLMPETRHGGYDACRSVHAEQNALIQAKEFSEVTKITGIVLTKLDGTAKGGVVIGICNELKIPVKYIGVGEKIDDLQKFSSEDFIKAILD